MWLAGNERSTVVYREKASLVRAPFTYQNLGELVGGSHRFTRVLAARRGESIKDSSRLVHFMNPLFEVPRADLPVEAKS